MEIINSLVFPGDVLGKEGEYINGEGTYIDRGLLKSTLFGKVSLQSSSTAKIISVTPKDAKKREAVIDVSAEVICRVTKISVNQAHVDILAVGDNEFKQQNPKGIIRREDIRKSEIDQLVLFECFRPGDIVKATVISLGDARQYFLSTAAPQYGVVWAKSESSNEILVPLSWKEMEDPVTKQKELRKVAKPL